MSSISLPRPIAQCVISSRLDQWLLLNLLLLEMALMHCFSRRVGRQVGRQDRQTGNAFVFHSIPSWDKHMSILWRMQRCVFVFCFDWGVCVLCRASCLVGNCCLSTLCRSPHRCWWFVGNIVPCFCTFTFLIVQLLDLFLKTHKSCDRCTDSKAVSH